MANSSRDKFPQQGLSNREATEIIIVGLRDLLKQREENFRDHTQKRKKKAIVALQRIFHPFTLLTLAYTGFLIYNTTLLYKDDESKPLDYMNKKSTIPQHIITICVVLLLVIIDVYLRIQRLNYRVFNIDSKIQQVIDQFDPNNKTDENKWIRKLYNQGQEKEFSYYQNCFTWTLRNKGWKKIPNNTLAEGDIIKLLPDDRAPALIVAQSDTGIATSSAGISKTPQLGQTGEVYFNKGSKIAASSGLLMRSQINLNLLNTTNTNDPHEAFERSKREYIVFKVLKTPCVQDLTEFISNMETRKNFSKNILYFSNIQTTERIVSVFQAISWVICVAINIGFIYSLNILDYFDHHTYLPLIGYSFMIPQIFSVCEAWANALMITLFNSLQFEDYNKKLTGYYNFYKQLKKQPNIIQNLNTDQSMVLQKPIQNQREAQKWSWKCFCCFCCHQTSRYQRKRKHHSKKKSKKTKKKEKRMQKMVAGFVKTDLFYERYDFQNRGLKKNWSKFWEFYRSGCTHLNNIFAQMSCVSVFAFVDKEGIISENSKYVDEIAAIDKDEKKLIFDLAHDSHVRKEEEIYAFENPNLYKENVNLLKALGLSFMCSRNPNEQDGEKQMKEIFTKEPALAEQIKNEIGFYFHNALRAETEEHQDCVCSLAKLIGHTDASFLNYEYITSIWNIKQNVSIGDKDKKKDKEDKKHRSFDDHEKSSRDGSLVDKKSQEEEECIKSENSIKGKDIFAAQKQHKKMLLERVHKFGHVITTIARDKTTGKFQSFTRGEANVIFNLCSDYWNGQKITPIKKEVKNHIKDILFQWQASDFSTIGFSYKPITPDAQALIEKRFNDDHQKARETLEAQQKNQIFLGIIGIKHHKKQEANKLFQSLEDAGIRGVLFSKEGVLETKNLAKELGIDSDWNAWISLAESPSDFTKLYNEDGNLILPFGIEGIKDHIRDVDKIPLQVPMFCDTTSETTRQMFQIYQENGDVVACIGNIMNSENLHIFQQANVAVGMMIEPSYRCYRCNGRISKFQQRAGVFGAIQTAEYKPTKLERLSASINALGCSFVFDANTNIYCFFSVFREARRLRESVEQALLLALFIYLNVFLILFVDLILGIYHYSDQLEILYILFIFVPLFSISCMARPTKNSIMKRHVLSPKYLPYLDFAIFMIKSHFIKVIVCTILLYILRIFYFNESINYFKNNYPQDYQIGFKDIGQDKIFAEQIKFLIYGNWYHLVQNYEYWQITIEMEHKFNFSLLLVILCYLTIGLESPKNTLFHKFTGNRIFKFILVLQLLFAILYYVLSTTVFLGTSYTQRDEINYYRPSYKIWLSALGVLVIIIIIEEVTKKHVRKLFERDHNRLSIFFSTKLGMWSPR